MFDESLKEFAEKVQFTKHYNIQETTNEENASTQANLEAIDDPNGAMTTIITSAPIATTSADISLTLLLDESPHYETFLSILGSETQNNGRRYAHLSISDDLTKNLVKKMTTYNLLGACIAPFQGTNFPLKK